MARKSRLYHLYDNEEYVGAYTCREIAEKTGCPAYKVCVDARNMTRYKKDGALQQLTKIREVGRMILQKNGMTRG